MVTSGVLAKAQVGLNFVNEISDILTIANETEFPDMVQCYFCGEKVSFLCNKCKVINITSFNIKELSYCVSLKILA
mgnify:CR=1 FL=1